MAIPLEAMTEGRPEQYAKRDAAFAAWDAEQRSNTREQAAFNAGWAARKAAQYAALTKPAASAKSES